jgi:putative acetyltransferase
MVKLNGLLICVSKEEVRMVIELLPEHIELTHQEEGCISFEVKQCLDPFIWEVLEVFDSMKSFKHHQSRTASSIWGVKTQNIKRQYKISEGD